MGMLTFVGRIILVVLNILFILVSLTLIVCGFILRFAHEWLRPQVKSVLENIETIVKDNYDGSTDFNTDKFELGSLVSTLAYVMIAVGVVLIAISFIGCCGACCSFTTLMLVYAIILIVLLLAQIAVVIVAFGRPDVIKDRIGTSIKSTMNEYDGIKGTTVSSLGWNWMMQEFDCCGADSYEDFEKEGSKYKDTGINDNAEMSGATGTVTTPVACCKTLPTSDAERTTCAGQSSTLPTETDSNRNKGCVDEVWTRIMDTSQTYFYIAIGLCFVAQIVLIIFAILVYKNRGVTGGLV